MSTGSAQFPVSVHHYPYAWNAFHHLFYPFWIIPIRSTFSSFAGNPCFATTESMCYWNVCECLCMYICKSIASMFHCQTEFSFPLFNFTVQWLLIIHHAVLWKHNGLHLSLIPQIPLFPLMHKYYLCFHKVSTTLLSQLIKRVINWHS